MRLNYCLIIVACGLLATAVADEKWTFEDAQVGTVPQGWLAGVTGAKEGAAPRWEVRRDEGRNLLAQLESGGARSDFPVCLKADSKFKNGTVSVRLKPISGTIDQAGGVVFRASDRDNFYIVRANALENNISIYVTRNGKRETIKYWENIEIGLNQWHELRVEAKGFTFKVWLNDNFVGEINDANQIFSGAGMVGVWTKADSVTYFDTLAVSDDNSER